MIVRTGTNPVGRPLDAVRSFACEAHEGQLDKLKRDYFSAHVLPVAEALEPFGELAQMVGYLHDILEDSSVTISDFPTFVPSAVCVAVEAVTRDNGESYENFIQRAALHHLSAVAKLADNSVNLRANALLAEQDPQKAASLRVRYLAARAVLLASVREGLRTGDLTSVGQPWILEDRV